MVGIEKTSDGAFERYNVPTFKRVNASMFPTGVTE